MITQKKQQPRGIRNNNPLNMVRTRRSKWVGMRPQQTDKMFCQASLRTTLCRDLLTTTSHGHESSMLCAVWRTAALSLPMISRWGIACF